MRTAKLVEYGIAYTEIDVSFGCNDAVRLFFTSLFCTESQRCQAAIISSVQKIGPAKRSAVKEIAFVCKKKKKKTRRSRKIFNVGCWPVSAKPSRFHRRRQTLRVIVNWVGLDRSL